MTTASRLGLSGLEFRDSDACANLRRQEPVKSPGCDALSITIHASQLNSVTGLRARVSCPGMDQIRRPTQGVVLLAAWRML